VALTQPEEEVGEVSSALCSDLGIAQYVGTLGSTAGSTVSQTGVPPYGTAACPSSFVIDALATGNKEIVASAAWVDTSVASSQSACESARLSGTPYGFNGSSWVALALPKTIAGSWDIDFNCSLMWTPSIQLAHLNPSGYSRIRVVVRAYSTSARGSSNKPVKGSIMIPEPLPPPPG
jgi:hypothetical protein